MEVQFSITNQDIRVANYAHALLRGARRLWVVYSLVGLFAIGMGVKMFMDTHNILPSIPLFLVAIILPFAEPFRRWLKSRSTIKSVPENERQFRFTFNEDGLEYDNQGLFSARYRWELISFVGDYTDLFLIYPKTDVDFCYILPKRAFKDEFKIREFGDLLGQKGIPIKIIK